MFHKKLKELRERQNLTQKKLADILKISRSSLSSYETGTREPDFSILKDIAAFFNVTLDYLLDFNVTVNNNNNNDDLRNKIFKDIVLLDTASLCELEKYVKMLKIYELYIHDSEKNKLN